MINFIVSINNDKVILTLWPRVQAEKCQNNSGAKTHINKVVKKICEWLRRKLGHCRVYFLLKLTFFISRE